MTQSSSKDLALRFLQSFWDGDTEGGLALCAADAQWTFQKSLRAPRHAGIREAVGWLNENLITGFDPDSGYSVEVKNAIAEEGEVAIEYSARGRTNAGAVYANDYLVRFTVEDGLIRSVRPYFDTHYVHRRLVRLADNDNE